MNFTKIAFAIFHLVLFTSIAYSKDNIDDITSNYIKSAAFIKNNMAVNPFFKLGESINFEFDDLLAEESNYYYNIKQFNYDWTPSKLSKMEYLQGTDNPKIDNYSNSFNTLQLYSHYTLRIPNKNSRILKSGNYILEIYNSYNEVVIKRKFIVYENIVNIGALIKRSRDISTITSKQNVEFTIKLGDVTFQNPTENIKVSIFQNGQWTTSISNIKPQYIIGKDLVYKYNKETQFWAGNEYLNFDNKDIRGGNNTVLKVTTDEIYNTYLYPNYLRKNHPYTLYPDVNGSFFPRNINRENSSIEADYSWVYFTLMDPDTFEEKQIYIRGMFNNNEFTEDNLMTYNAKNNAYEKAILIKQGFTNFQYTTIKNNRIDFEDAVDGNFSQTENEYQILVYYRGNNDLYDRVIGMGIANSEDISY